MDARPSSAAAAAAVDAGTRVLTGSAVVDTTGGRRRPDLRRHRPQHQRRRRTHLRRDPERSPATCWPSPAAGPRWCTCTASARASCRWDDDLAAFVPGSAVPDQQVVGAGRGTFELADCLAEGVSAGGARPPARAPGLQASRRRHAVVLPASRRPSAPTRQLWLVPAAAGRRRPTGTTTSWTSSATRPWPTCCAPPGPACARWSTSSATPRSAPPTTRARPPASTRSASSPPHCARPAKRPGASATSAPPPTAHRSPRWPSRPWPAASAASCSTPPALTSIHPWHVAQGALFEDVGQWKRPWYYPQAGEDMDTAVLRECAAVRDSVGFMDATTLGKIEIRGKDAGEFLNRDLHQRVQEARAGLGPLRRDVHARRDDLRRRRDPAPGRGPVLHDHHHRRRRQGAGLAGGMAADRMAGTGRALHLGDRAVDHHRRRRAEVPRRSSPSWRRNWPPTAASTPRPSRS